MNVKVLQRSGKFKKFKCDDPVKNVSILTFHLLFILNIKVKNDDLDFWLSTETALPKETESIPIITEAVIDKKERSKKSKSKKKEIEAEFDSEVKIKEKKKKEKSSSSNVPIDENAVINNGLDEKLNDIKTNGSMLPKTKSFQELAANKQMKIVIF